MIIYREAVPSDAESLLLHLNTVGKETDNLSFSGFNISKESEARFIKRFADSEYDIMIVALYGDLVVGNGVIEREKIPRYNHRATLSITVLREYWGRGIGTEIMSRLLSFSREAGIRTVSLEVRADNERAVSLYEKFGFAVVGTFRDYFNINGVYHDALIMQIVF